MMKKRIFSVAVVALVAVGAVAVMLPLQAALADAPPEVKAVMTFVQATWTAGTLTVTQGGPAGTVQTVDCPEGSATSVKFSGAEGEDGKAMPLEVQCFEIQPGDITTLPDGAGNFTISTMPADGLPTLDCVSGEPVEVKEGKAVTVFTAKTGKVKEIKGQKLAPVTVVQVPESGTQVMPAEVAGTAMVIDCAGGTQESK